MTEPKASSSADQAPGDKAQDKSTAPGNAAKAAPASPAASKGRKGSGGTLVIVVLLVLVVALGGVAWFQYQTWQKSHQSMASQLAQSTAAAGQADQLARQAQAVASAQADQLTQLQAQVGELQAQIGSLDQAFQVLTDSGSDLVLLNDIDHLVSIANQQILLGGNVANAVVALETAQARLARANRPALASLQQTLNGDLERLRAAATVDVASVSRQLEQLGGLLNQAPLLVPDDAVPRVDTSERDAALKPSQAAPDFQSDPNAPWWRNGLDAGAHWAAQAWGVLRHDLAGFISVRRVDNESALLISPDQADQLRLTLRLRLMTAQLALMMRQPEVWKTEMLSVGQVLQSHFDKQSPLTQRAALLASRLADTPVDAKLPAPAQTLQVLEALRQESAQAIERRRSPSSIDSSQPQAAPAQPDASSSDTAAPSQGENAGPAALPAPSAPDQGAAAPLAPAQAPSASPAASDPAAQPAAEASSVSAVHSALAAVQG
ncbi:uroporphyrinogen-III C-methyltransferase [Pusillimonas minor]|uniref:Uroporphyrinogen-III C-methyltransferase n=1 Tax=Pusillimonas minor TaxID=2697024 RepID=A0A842HSB8_9BURK|nr:uroporphyrinogen-III C-methyltransferase [Pusillimonas minor]MBC2771143.1 uroporphyrinogen-III C-methyltransferase [Pusillimonas minor]